METLFFIITFVVPYVLVTGYQFWLFTVEHQPWWLYAIWATVNVVLVPAGTFLGLHLSERIDDLVYCIKDKRTRIREVRGGNA